MSNFQANNKRLRILEESLRPDTRERVFIIDEKREYAFVHGREIPYETFLKIYPGPYKMLLIDDVTPKMACWEYEREIMHREEGQKYNQAIIDHYEEKYLGGKK